MSTHLRISLVVMLLLALIPGFVWASESLQEILANLNHSDWRFRRDAATSIGDLQNPEGLLYLEQALDDQDLNVRWAAIEAMVKIGSLSVPSLIKAIDHADMNISKWAVEGLGKIGPDAEEAVPVLIGLLDMDNPLHMSAINALGAISHNAGEAIPHLALLLGEEFRVVVAVNKAIKQINLQADLVTILLQALENNDESMQLRAVGALCGLGVEARSAIPVLAEMLQAKSQNLRKAAARTLGSLGPAAKECTNLLIDLLYDPIDSVKLAAVEALGAIKAAPEITVPVLTEMLFDSNSDIKRATLRALSAFRDNAELAAPYVVLLIGDNNPVISRMAKDTLTTIASRKSLATLVTNLLKAESENLRIKAAIALAYEEAEQDQAVELLINALSDPSVEVRAAAAISLGNLGNAAFKAVENLVRAAQDPELRVSWAAVISLGNIAPETVGEIVKTVGSEHVPILVEAAANDLPNIREPAIAILKEIAEEIGLVESMTVALNQGDEQMRYRAVNVLHAIGSDVKAAVGALVFGLEDSNAAIVKAAESALLELTGETCIAAVVATALSHQDPQVQAAARRIAQYYPPIYASLEHDTMTQVIGYPAIVTDNDQLPVMQILPLRDGRLKVSVTVDQKNAIREVDLPVIAGTKITIELSQDEPLLGTYKVQIAYLTDQGLLYYDAFYFTIQDRDTIPSNSSKAAHLSQDSRIVYVPDYKGNLLPDFSTVGYMGGGVPLPEAPVKIEVKPGPGDDTERIQEAIDYVSQLGLDENGIRGAVLLKAGVYEIGKHLKINASGVILRGQGQGDLDQLWLDPAKQYTLEELKEALEGRKATILIATGSSIRKILQVGGTGSISIDESSETKILDQYVPVGANSFHVVDPERFAVGDSIIVRRYGNAAWISELGMDRIPPRADGGTITQWSPFHVDYEHVITAIEGSKVTINSTLVNAIEDQWGGGSILHYTDHNRIGQVGVENLRAIAYWNPDRSGIDNTQHADTFLDLYNIRDSWVKNTTLEHFYSADGAVRLARGSAWITIQDSSTLIADDRYYVGYVGRYGYHLQGHSHLIMRCYVLRNRHGYVFGSRVPGPNVFLDCVGDRSLATSEPHHRWSTGGLYDNVHDKIALMNRSNMGSGHGWAGANFVAWNTEGTLTCHQPPTAQNWAIGHVGRKDSGGNRGPDGFWDSLGRHVEPRSLYLQQLHERLGEVALHNIGY